MDPVEPILQFFAYEHLPPHLKGISKPFCELAHAIALGDNCPESGNVTLGPPMPRNAERSVALRKLLEAKDAAVRAVLAKVGAILLLLFLAQTADAQLLRRIFRPPVQSGCANGQCEVPSVAQAAPVEVIAADPAPRSLAAKSFAGALQSQLAANARPGLAERHYLRILNGPDSPRRDRQIARMERLVRAELDIGPTAAIDWAAVDWGAILRFLLTILPLFL